MNKSGPSRKMGLNLSSFPNEYAFLASLNRKLPIKHAESTPVLGSRPVASQCAALTFWRLAFPAIPAELERGRQPSRCVEEVRTALLLCRRVGGEERRFPLPMRWPAAFPLESAIGLWDDDNADDSGGGRLPCWQDPGKDPEERVEECWSFLRHRGVPS